MLPWSMRMVCHRVELSSLLSLLTVVAAWLRTRQSLVALALQWVLLWTGVASTEARFCCRVGEGREEAREREEAQDSDSHELDNRWNREH